MNRLYRRQNRQLFGTDVKRRDAKSSAVLLFYVDRFVNVVAYN
jgi:hypothetical protein